MITAHTRVLALLGHPVGHSRSPALHNGWLQALGIDAVYVAMDCGGRDIDPAQVVRAGLWGANITIPLKRRCTPERLERAAEATGARFVTTWAKIHQEDGFLDRPFTRAMAAGERPPNLGRRNRP